MIDWISLIFSIFWVFGFALILATFGYHHFIAQTSTKTLRQQLEQPIFSLSLWLGLSLVAIGFAGNSTAVWETLVWIALAIGAIYYMIDAARQTRTTLTK